MLVMTQINLENIWDIVRQIRKAFLSKYNDPKYPKKNPSPSLLSESNIKVNIGILEAKLEMNTTYSTNEDISDKTLETAAEMFTYLNYYPSTELRVFSHLIEDLINSKSAKNILIALSSMIKTTQNAGKESLTKIFTKAMELYKLNIYSNIDKITKEKGFADC